MTKYVVISVNENPEYLFYLPLVVWAWRKFGWDPIVFYTETTSPSVVANRYIPRECFSWFHRLLIPEGYKSETIAQISRLYASSLYGGWDDFLMTSDVDMLPLSDYWKFDAEELNIWGHDLTNFEHVPICYIGAIRARWKLIMGIGPKQHNYNSLIARDIAQIPNASSDDQSAIWVVDQDWITDRIREYEVSLPVKRFHRGTLPNGYPIGRVDRSAWSLDHRQLIDCHMERGIWKDTLKQVRLMDLLKKIWPLEDFGWVTQYIKEFAESEAGK